MLSIRLHVEPFLKRDGSGLAEGVEILRAERSVLEKYAAELISNSGVERTKKSSRQIYFW